MIWVTSKLYVLTPTDAHHHKPCSEPDTVKAASDVPPLPRPSDRFPSVTWPLCTVLVSWDLVRLPHSAVQSTTEPAARSEIVTNSKNDGFDCSVTRHVPKYNSSMMCRLKMLVSPDCDCLRSSFPHAARGTFKALMSVPLFGTFFVGASYPIFETNFTRVDATHWVSKTAVITRCVHMQVVMT